MLISMGPSTVGFVKNMGVEWVDGSTVGVCSMTLRGECTSACRCRQTDCSFCGVEGKPFDLFVSSFAWRIAADGMPSLLFAGTSNKRGF